VYSAFGTADFNRIVFSNESKFVTFSNTRRYVWRPKNSRYNVKYTCKTVKYGGVSLMVWGAIRADGKRILTKCPPRLG